LLSRAFLVFSFGDAEGGFVHAGLFSVFVFIRAKTQDRLVHGRAHRRA
jgi:hypothetical protein